MQTNHPEDQPKTEEVIQPAAVLDLPEFAAEEETLPADPPVEVAPEPVPVVKTAAQHRLDTFVAMVRENRKPKPAPEPGKPTFRQAANTNQEMDAGRRRVAHAREQERLRPRPVKDPSEGTMTPVYRPPAHVPGMGHARAKT